MGKSVRFAHYIGVISGCRIKYVTAVDGSTEPGRRALPFSADEARSKLCELLDKGITNAVIVAAPQKATGSKFYNSTESSVLGDDVIEAMEKRGFTHWIHGDKNRLYADANDIGLDFGLRFTAENNYTRTYNATFCGEPIEPRQAFEMQHSGWVYIDCCTGAVRSNHDLLLARAKELLGEAIASVAHVQSRQTP